MKLIKVEQGWIAVDESKPIKIGDIVFDTQTGNIYESKKDWDIQVSVEMPPIHSSTFPIEGVKRFSMPEKESIEDIYFKYIGGKENHNEDSNIDINHKLGFEQGYKAAQAKQFTKDDMKKAMMFSVSKFAFENEIDAYIGSLTEPTYTKIEFETIRTDCNYIDCLETHTEYKINSKGELIIKTLK